jgi:ABC-2 type transport system ATP-binding protein
MPDAIVAAGLVKKYGPVIALDGLDLVVPEATVTGLLGPNGAGKTTAVRVLTTLLVADSGWAEVAGFDVRTQGRELRRIMGVSGQFAAVDDDMTGFETLDMVGRLYHLGRKRSRERARELLERFDLVDAAERTVKGYSGGMRRRLDLAGALVVRPKVLFLDEPTTGLDPRSRLAMWDIIDELVNDGSTVLLTTQYLEEADRIANSIAVIDQGKVVAEGTADKLKAMVGGEQLELVVVDADHLPQVISMLAQLGSHEPRVRGSQVTVEVEHGTAKLRAALTQCDEAGIELHNVGIRRPTLDEVFLKLTGREVQENNDQSAEGTA